MHFMEQNEHLHLSCKTKKYTLLRRNRNQYETHFDHIDIKWCLVHKMFICRCGWEFRWHLGERTVIPNSYRVKNFEEPKVLETFWPLASETIREMILMTQQKYEPTSVLQTV